MAHSRWHKPPAALRDALAKILSPGDAHEVYEYLSEQHRHIYGINPSTVDYEGTLNAENVVEVESLKTAETDQYKALKASGDGRTVSFGSVPDGGVKFVTLESSASIPNARILTGGTNITVVEDSTAKTATVNVSPQGAGSLLDADLLDARHASQFVWSVAKAGDTALTGDVTLSEGAGVTLTQAGQDIEISTTPGASGFDEETFLMGLLV